MGEWVRKKLVNVRWIKFGCESPQFWEANVKSQILN
jgi:hypothetical protein